jgi:hypothetical protein
VLDRLVSRLVLDLGSYMSCGAPYERARTAMCGEEKLGRRRKQAGERGPARRSWGKLHFDRGKKEGKKKEGLVTEGTTAAQEHFHSGPSHPIPAHLIYTAHSE